MTSFLSFLPAFATVVFLAVAFALPATTPATVKGAYKAAAPPATKTYVPGK